LAPPFFLSLLSYLPLPVSPCLSLYSTPSHASLPSSVSLSSFLLPYPSLAILSSHPPPSSTYLPPNALLFSLPCPVSLPICSPSPSTACSALSHLAAEDGRLWGGAPYRCLSFTCGEQAPSFAHTSRRVRHRISLAGRCSRQMPTPASFPLTFPSPASPPRRREMSSPAPEPTRGHRRIPLAAPPRTPRRRARRPLPHSPMVPGARWRAS